LLDLCQVTDYTIAFRSKTEDPQRGGRKEGRSTRNSAKAGTVSEFGRSFPRIKRVLKPKATTDLGLRIQEAERQIEYTGESFTAVKLEEQLVPGNWGIQGRLINPSLPITSGSTSNAAEKDQQNSQTNRTISTMVDKKAMVVPGTRDAPKFHSNNPIELRRFIRQIEDLWKEAGIEDTKEKKESIGKYADAKSEEEWSSFISYRDGYTWDEFKEELLNNYPEAAEAELGSPDRLKKIIREANNIKIGDLGNLYKYKRAFMTEANKLKKHPWNMSNRDLVGHFMDGLSLHLGREVLQDMRNSAKQREAEDEVAEKGKASTSTSRIKRRKTREEDFDLEEICESAIDVSAGALGQLSRRFVQEKESTMIQTSSKESSTLANKIESIEEAQALQKDRQEIASKHMDSKLEAIEAMIKNFVSQNQEKTPSSFVQNVGPIKYGMSNDILGKPLKTPFNITDAVCYGCGESGHFQNACEKIKALIQKGVITHSREGRICLPDGSRVPIIPGACLVERIEKYYTTMRPSQAYYGTFEEAEERLLGLVPKETTNMNREVLDEREQRIAKLEREISIRDRENAITAKLLKLSEKGPEKADTSVYSLEQFSKELAALQGDRPDFH
jgi:hypothetical protein